jgi:hypothetical protein
MYANIAQMLVEISSAWPRNQRSRDSSPKCRIVSSSPPSWRRAAGEADHGADDGERDELAAPVGEAGDLAAGDRGEDRGQAGDQHHQGEDAGRLGPLEQVADDRPRDHQSGRSGEALQQAQHDQRPDAGGEGAQHRGDDVQGDADQQRRTAAGAVTQRPGEQLPGGQADHAHRDRELAERVGGVQIVGELGQDRQVEVERERAEGRECAQRDEDLHAAGTGQCDLTHADTGMLYWITPQSYPSSLRDPCSGFQGMKQYISV